MNRRALTLGTGVLALAGFGAAAWLYPQPLPGGTAPAGPAGEDDVYIRAHSPIIGPPTARVTIIEFFDPSCEACRAFHPILNQMLRMHPADLRLVLRYTPLHKGSDEAVRILEAARRQDRFEPVLDALFARQPEWAVHGAPRLDLAWRIAGQAGLDLERARRDGALLEVDRVLATDIADLKALQVRQTPTFFVNRRPLLAFGARQLYELVLSELAATQP